MKPHSLTISSSSDTLIASSTSSRKSKASRQFICQVTMTSVARDRRWWSHQKWKDSTATSMTRVCGSSSINSTFTISTESFMRCHYSKRKRLTRSTRSRDTHEFSSHTFPSSCRPAPFHIKQFSDLNRTSFSPGTITSRRKSPARWIDCVSRPTRIFSRTRWTTIWRR